MVFLSSMKDTDVDHLPAGTLMVMSPPCSLVIRALARLMILILMLLVVTMAVATTEASVMSHQTRLSLLH